MITSISLIAAIGIAPFGLSTQPVRADFRGPITEVVPADPNSVVTQRSALPLSDVAQEGFETEFSTGVYFGAFAVGKSGAFGYSIGVNSIDAARAVALAQCRQYDPACLIWADILPAGYTPPEPGQIVLTPEVANLFFTPQKRPPFVALALSYDGAYSLVWGHATQAEADAAALTDCDIYRITDLPDLPDMPCMILRGAR